jgi:hypothetical protein
MPKMEEQPIESLKANNLTDLVQTISTRAAQMFVEHYQEYGELAHTLPLKLEVAKGDEFDADKSISVFVSLLYKELAASDLTNVSVQTAITHQTRYSVTFDLIVTSYPKTDGFLIASNQTIH